MKKTIIALITATLTLSAFTFIATYDWKVAENLNGITFSTKAANGTIGGLKGTIEFDKNNLSAAKFDVSVDVKTLNTGNAMKTDHALAADFFNVEKFPTIKFKTSSIEKSDVGYTAKGKLTIKDVTKEIAIPFTFDETGNEATLKGKFDIKRMDYNLKRAGVGEVVEIELNLPLKK